MSRKQAEMLGMDIEQQPLNVNIKSSDLRVQASAKTSKLPHLMAHKQVGNAKNQKRTGAAQQNK